MLANPRQPFGGFQTGAIASAFTPANERAVLYAQAGMRSQARVGGRRGTARLGRPVPDSSRRLIEPGMR
jgi:hypothetical protein